MTKDIKQLILDNLDDSIARFLYYDRKEDFELPVGAIEAAIMNGSITAYDLIRLFSDRIYSCIGSD